MLLSLNSNIQKIYKLIFIWLGMSTRDTLSWGRALGIPLAVSGALAIGMVCGRRDRELSAYESPGRIEQRVSAPNQESPTTRNSGETLEKRSEDVKTNVNIERGYNLPNPYTRDNTFGHDSEQMILARALYGESRKQIETSPDYVYGAARTIINRADRSGKSIKKVILKNNGVTWQYSCFNPKDPNFKRLQDPLGWRDAKPEAESEVLKKAWAGCYVLAGRALKGDLQGREDLKDVTNYYVGKSALSQKFKLLRGAKARGIPSWAYQKDKKGKFKRNGKGYLVPRKPAGEVDVGKFGTAYFFRLKNF